MSTNLKIAIVEPSVIVRIGLEGLLRRLPGFHVQIVEIAEEAVMGSLRMHKPDVLLVNPVDGGDFMSRHWKEECGCPDLKCVALLYALFDERILRHYDERISVYDSMDEVKRKLERLVAEDIPDEEMDDEEARTLSSREKEIVVCVVKGMTNREIADRLFLSAHTVITHRRNIARKLQIHSVSGLTVYAIVNKLVELGDIKR